MKITSMIPPQYRLAAILIALAVLVVVSCTAGSVVSWKLATAASDQSWSGKLDACKTSLADSAASVEALKASLATQNREVDRLKELSDAADRARAQAEAAAREQAKAGDRRVAALQARLNAGATCGQALESYWEASR